MRYLLLISITCLLLSACGKEEIPVLANKITVSTNERINQVYFLDDNNGYAVGGERYNNGMVLKTTNGGLDWTVTNNLSETTLYSVHFMNEMVGHAVGYSGGVVRTEDAGGTWSFVRYASYDRLNDVRVLSFNEIIMVGGDGFDEGISSYTKDNWWEMTRDTFQPSWLAMDMINATEAIVVGYGAMAKTSDAGETWHYIDVQGDFFSDIKFVDNNTAFVCGLQGSILKTDDAGNNWTIQRKTNRAFSKRDHLEAIDFISPDIGVAVGFNGLVLYTNNGGEDWEKVEEFTSANLRTVEMLDNDHAIVAGDHGEMWMLQF